MVVDSCVLVKSPVTAEGVINSVVPFPLEVLIVVSNSTHSVPSAVGLQRGLKFPLLALSVQTVGLTSASKLPLLCAKAVDTESTSRVNTNADRFIIPPHLH